MNRTDTLMNWRVLLAMLCMTLFAVIGSAAQNKTSDDINYSKQLAFMLGDWRVDAKIRTSPISFINGKGTMKVHLDNGTLLADMKIKFDNFEVNGTTKRIFDKAREQWDVSWHPDGQTPTLAIEGKMLNGRFIEIDHGKDEYGAFIGRLVIFDISNDKFSVRKDRLYDDGTLMKDVWVYEAVRVRSAN